MHKVIDAADIMADARALVEAISMAASELPERQESAIGTVAQLAVDMLSRRETFLRAIAEMASCHERAPQFKCHDFHVGMTKFSGVWP